MNMKPMIILPSDVMSKDDIEILRANNICVVVATDPSKVRFVDPIPAQSSRTDIENAAIKLSRKILSGHFNEDSTKTFAQMYVSLLVQGTPLDSRPSQAEMEKRAYDESKLEEVRKLAREDARAERFAKKQGK